LPESIADAGVFDESATWGEAAQREAAGGDAARCRTGRADL